MVECIDTAEWTGKKALGEDQAELNRYNCAD
jgi:hypothetical protein